MSSTKNAINTTNANEKENKNMGKKVTKELVGFDRKTMNITAKNLLKAVENETANFNNAVQRSLVWDNARKSLLIHSMIINSPIPPLYATRDSETKVYDYLDGKQRTNAIVSFMRDEYVLEDIPVLEYTDGSTLDINGKKFSELDEDFQDAIKTYSLSVIYFDDLADDEEAEIFYRLNNGKAMSAIEISRVHCPSLDKVQILAEHPLFDSLTDKARARYTDEDLVVKAFAITSQDEPCLDTKAIRPYMATLSISDKDTKKMTTLFDRMKKISDACENPKLKKRVNVRTHMLSIIQFLNKHSEDVTDFIKYFYDSSKSSSISKKYSQNAMSGSNHAAQVKGRFDALEAEYAKYKANPPKVEAPKATPEETKKSEVAKNIANKKLEAVVDNVKKEAVAPKATPKSKVVKLPEVAKV